MSSGNSFFYYIKIAPNLDLSFRYNRLQAEAYPWVDMDSYPSLFNHHADVRRVSDADIRTKLFVENSCTEQFKGNNNFFFT